MTIRERRIRVAIYLIFSIFILIDVCFSLYTMFWVRMLTGFFALVAGLAVMPLKRQIKAQEANTPELKRIRFVLLVGHGVLVLALLLLLPKTIMF